MRRKVSSVFWNCGVIIFSIGYICSGGKSLSAVWTRCFIKSWFACATGRTLFPSVASPLGVQVSCILQGTHHTRPSIASCSLPLFPLHYTILSAAIYHLDTSSLVLCWRSVFKCLTYFRLFASSSSFMVRALGRPYFWGTAPPSFVAISLFLLRFVAIIYLHLFRLLLFDCAILGDQPPCTGSPIPSLYVTRPLHTVIRSDNDTWCHFDRAT